MNCASVTPQSVVVCRLCTKSHEYYVNIFISNESCEIMVEEAIQDLLGLPVTVGDGLPNFVCRLCVRKLIEFREFKNMCFKSATELRAYALGNDFLISKIKDEDAAEVDTSGEGTSQENPFLNDMHVTEVYVTTPDELAVGNVGDAKEELWSTENALVVKEEVNDGEHRIEGFVQVNALTSVALDPLAVNTMSDAKDELLSTGNALVVKEEISGEEHCIEGNVPMNALASVAVDPLAVNTMALKEEAQEPKMAAGKGNSLDDTSPHNHIRVTEAFVPFPAELAMGTVMYAEEDSRPTELIVKEEIGEGLECSENDVPLVSVSSVNVDPLAVDTTVDRCNNTGGLVMDPGNESDKFVADGQWISQKDVLNNPSFDPVREEYLQPEHSMENAFVVNSLPEEWVKNQRNNVECHALSKIFSQSNDWARSARNHEREQLCHQAENTCYHTDYICNYSSTRCSEKKSLAIHIKRHDGTKSARVLPKKNFPPSFSQRLLVKDQGHVEPVIQETSNISFSPNNCGGVKPFKCNQCGKMFYNSSNLKAHLVVHTSVKAFKCNDCGKTFSSRSHLNRHAVVHTGVKAFECNDCGKLFARKSHLKTHLVVHTGVKSFKCNQCGKMFRRKSHLKTHSVVHTSVKAFKCNDCGKTFSLRSNLNTHSVVHTGVKGFDCNDCGKIFTRKSHLKSHLVVHTGVRLFKCTECGKMFATSGDLKSHSVLHTGVKPYKCNFCGKQFKWRSGFNSHLLTHADRNPSK